MKVYIIRRLLQMIPTLLAISFLIFGLLYIVPGDPVYIMLGASETQSVDQETYNQVREDLGLDKPFFTRYFSFVADALKGDLGKSYNTGKDVFLEIKARIPNTLILTFGAMAIALIIAVPLGILAAVKHNSIWDTMATFLATVSVSLPKFWFALVMIIVFSLKLRWFPSQGIGSLDEGLWLFLKHLALPSFSLGLGLAATQTRMIRSSMLDVLNQDYIRFAKSKGQKDLKILTGHALKNAMIPVVTVIGSELGALLGGAVVTETIFAWPGVGRMVVNAIGRRDYPVIQGATLVLCTMFILINLIVDLMYVWLNPKISFQSEEK